MAGAGAPVRSLGQSWPVGALSLSLLLVAGLAPAPMVGGDPAAEPSAASLLEDLSVGPDGALVAPEADLAAAAAGATGVPVVIDELTDEYTRHFANPDGTRLFEQYVVAQRTREESGWVPVDTTLRVSGDRVVPRATVLDMSFSAGGSGELVSVTDGETRLGLSWPGELPAPVLAGDTATYRDVLPGVDLVVRAEPESFAQMLVVKTRQAASHPALARLNWDVSTVGLELRTRPDGVVEAVDAAGEVAFLAPAPLMWDSPPRPAPLSMKTKAMAGEAWSPPVPDQETPGAVQEMPVRADGDELVVRPDLDLLTDPETVFPVMIDPSFSKKPANWAPVNKGDPNRSYPSGSSWPRDTIRVGATWGSPHLVFRTHLRFVISSMSGQDLVGNPSFHITLDHSASCDSTPVELWRTDTIGSSGNVTWNSMKSKWKHGKPLQTKKAHANEAGGCGGNQPDVAMEFSNSNIRTRLQSALDVDHNSFTFGLRAPNESNEYQWKRFKPGSAKLTAVYNLKPAKPTNLAITGDCYPGACSSPAMVRNRRPTLKAKVSDPNGDLMTVQFQVRNAAKSSVVASTTAVSNVSSGSSPTWRTPTLPNEAQYHFRVRAKDGVGWGPWSSYYTFYVDTSAPDEPEVSGDPYTHKDTKEWNGGVGQPGDFTFDSGGEDDVVSYQWRVNGGTVTTESVTAGAQKTVQITPTGELEQLLEVRSVDHAGNASEWARYPFYVRPQPVDVAYWKFDEGTGTTAQTATGDPAYAGTLHGGASWVDSELGLVDPEASGTAVALDGVDDYVEMPRVLATNHAAGFSVSAWVRPDTLSGDGVVLAQHGGSAYAFRLSYEAGSDQWCFRVTQADDPMAAETAVCSSTDPQTGVWTHLAGVYDRPSGKLRLFVNGGPNVFDPEFGQGTAAEVTVPPLWASVGSFTVGRLLTGGDYWHGRIDEVRTYQRVLLESDVAQMFSSCRFGTCPGATASPDPVLVGAWDLDEGSGTVAADSSGLSSHAALAGGAAWTAGGYRDTAAVSFDGVDATVETGGPVLLTDESFTVAAWARLDDLTEYRAVISQDGQVMSPFQLDYSPIADQWCLRMRHSDAAAAPSTAACGGTPQAGVWTHLAGVYDAAALELRLYVDGQLVATTPYSNPAWRGEGALAIGRALTNGAASTFFAGDIDLVRAYQGAMPAAQVANLYAEQVDLSPTAVITSPSAALTWTVGDEVSFTGLASDPQGALPATALSWRLWLNDCTVSPCQRDVLREWTGVDSGSFTAPDVTYPAHLELELVAEGSSGQADTSVVRLDPATTELTFATDPAGLELLVNSDTEQAPVVRTVIPGASVVVEAPATQDGAGTTYAFEGWSDGAEPERTITAPATATTYTATYLPVVELQPTATIDSPTSGLLWRAGDEVAFSGSALDAEGPLPASALSWELRLVDCTVSPCDVVVLDNQVGVDEGVFVAPDVVYPAHLELELTADNGPGYTDSAVVQLDPATVGLTFDSVPQGLDLSVNGEPEATPFTRTVIQGSTVAVDAPQPQQDGGTTYVFDAWSGGGTRAHEFEAPTSPASYTATYQPQSPGLGCGTDDYGYTCTEGPRSFLPTTGVLDLTGDDQVAEVALPFPVWFYGQVYETAYVDTNGLVTFLAPEWSAWGPSTIPSAYTWGASNAAVYAFWDDLNVDSLASVRTGLVGAAPERQFVIEWESVTAWSDPSFRISVQVVLSETGEVAILFDGIDSLPEEQGADAVVGIENEDGTDALPYSQFTASLVDGNGVLFTPPAPGTISGVVTEAGTGNPVENAQVLLNPGGATAVTAADGSYQFVNVPVGTHTVVAHRDDGACAGAQAAALVPVTTGGQHIADLDIEPAGDTFGYTCAEGAETFLPTTNVLDLEGYAAVEEVPLPFPVWFYGQVYEAAYVDVNGLVTFVAPDWSSTTPSAIPSPYTHGASNAAVYAFWDDLVVDSTASVRTGLVGTAPERQFVIEWHDVWSGDRQSRISFQVVLHETGDISVLWDSLDRRRSAQGQGAVVGIENADGTDALVYSQFTATLASGQGITFSPPAPGTVSGVVTQAGTGVPVPDALVVLNPGGATTVTAADGSYEFVDVPVGTHAVVAHRDDGVCAGVDATEVVPVGAGAAVTSDLTVGPGTDAFGNTCSEAPETFLPAATTLPLSGYNGSVEVSLPFPVTLYGQAYTTAWVDVDGVVTFQEPDGALTNISAIPSAPASGTTNAAVYAFWNDWIVEEGASVRTGLVGTAPDRAFVVEWRDVWLWDWSAQVSFQVVFYESGEISVAWDGIDPSLAAQGLYGVVGIENATGTDALVYSQFTPVLSSGQGVRFEGPGGP